MNNIFLLPTYANPKNMKDIREATEHISRICYEAEGKSLEVSETNSLTQDKYCLRLHSSTYIVEGDENRIHEGMIHHHPVGHEDRHLQFKLVHKREVIHINLEPLSHEDYENCIKGFLSITCRIIAQEGIMVGNRDLASHFFNEKIVHLEHERRFLLRKIKQAFEKGHFLLDDETPVDGEQFSILKTEPHLLPFLEWE